MPPRAFAADLPGHEVSTLPQAGFAGAKNGELLKLIAAAGFDAFITVDKNLPSEQRSAKLPFGIVVLRARSNRLQDLQPLARKTLEALKDLKSGVVVVVSRGNQ